MIDHDALTELYQFVAFSFLAPYALSVVIAAVLTLIMLAWSGIRATWRRRMRPFP